MTFSGVLRISVANLSSTPVTCLRHREIRKPDSELNRRRRRRRRRRYLNMNARARPATILYNVMCAAHIFNNVRVRVYIICTLRSRSANFGITYRRDNSTTNSITPRECIGFSYNVYRRRFDCNRNFDIKFVVNNSFFFSVFKCIYLNESNYKYAIIIISSTNDSFWIKNSVNSINAINVVSHTILDPAATSRRFTHSTCLVDGCFHRISRTYIEDFFIELS